MPQRRFPSALSSFGRRTGPARAGVRQSPTVVLGRAPRGTAGSAGRLSHGIAAALLTVLLGGVPAFAAPAAPAAPGTAGTVGASSLDAIAPSHIAAAREVLRRLRVQDSVAPMVGQLSALISEQIQQWNPPADQEAEVARAVGKINDVLASELSWTNLETDYVVLYTETFSEAELKEIARFFGSDTGRKYVASVPQIQQRTMTIGQLRVARVQPQLEVLLGDLKRHLDVLALERGGAPAPAPTPEH